MNSEKKEKDSTKSKVFAMLNMDRGKYVSGEELSSELGITRTAVWKAVNSLKKEGHVIDACRNRGYLLQCDENSVSEVDVKRFMHFYADEVSVRVFGVVESTNLLARDMARHGVVQYTAIVAQEQTHGRGTHGRSFFSPPDTGLYMSIVLRPDESVTDALFITTAAAAACAEAIESIFEAKAEIKWVNDIYIDGKKVCGILTEGALRPDGSGIEYAVLGIGINVYKPRKDFPEEIRNIAHWLSDEPLCNIRSRLVAEILDRFIFYYKRLSEKPFLKSYRKRMLLTGKDVEFCESSTWSSGHVLGVTDDMKLELRLDSGEVKRLSSGDVRIKMM